MAVIRDVMPMFELFQPASVDDALALLERHGADAWVLAGGMDRNAPTIPQRGWLRWELSRFRAAWKRFWPEAGWAG